MNLREKYNLKQTCKTNKYRVHTQAMYILHVLAPNLLTNDEYLIMAAK